MTQLSCSFSPESEEGFDLTLNALLFAPLLFISFCSFLHPLSLPLSLMLSSHPPSCSPPPVLPQQPCPFLSPPLILTPLGVSHSLFSCFSVQEATRWLKVRLCSCLQLSAKQLQWKWYYSTSNLNADVPLQLKGASELWWACSPHFFRLNALQRLHRATSSHTVFIYFIAQQLQVV